jgi:hypothetical protein
MSRDWFAVYVGILTRPKYRRLSLVARAALFHIWCLAGGQRPEATWTSVEEFLDVLELDGYPAAAVYDELVERQWIEVDDDGRILVHDWDQHQLAATNAVRREYERDRKRDWRRAKPGVEPQSNPLPPAPPSPDITGSTQGQDTTTQVSPIVRDTSGTTRREPASLRALEGGGADSESFDAEAYDARVRAAQEARFARQGRRS